MLGEWVYMWQVAIMWASGLGRVGIYVGRVGIHMARASINVG